MSDYKTAFTLAENMQDSIYMWRINNYIANIYKKMTYWDEALEIYAESVNLANGNVENALTDAKACQRDEQICKLRDQVGGGILRLGKTCGVQRHHQKHKHF